MDYIDYLCLLHCIDMNMLSKSGLYNMLYLVDLCSLQWIEVQNDWKSEWSEISYLLGYLG
jgi:hypothetical protein